MYKKFFSISLAVILTAGYVIAQPPQSGSPSEVRFHVPFVEKFDVPKLDFFNPNFRRPTEANNFREDDSRYHFSRKITPQPEDESYVLVLRLDPEDPAGAGRGPEIISKDFTHFGSYSIRLKVPNVVDVQPNVGAVVGYFTYHMDAAAGLSEIDVEWLIADPEIIYVGTWTGPRGNLQRVGRIINMATGHIYNTYWRVGTGSNATFTERAQNQPETIQPIENFNASTQFYTYGFDWYPDRVVWWIIHPVTEAKIVLWDYAGSTLDFTGIPSNYSRYRVNFWHTNNWWVETNRNSIDKPLFPYEVEIEWISYTPF